MDANPAIERRWGMNNITANVFLISMSILYLAMGACIMYLLVRKIKQDAEKDKDKGGEK